MKTSHILMLFITATILTCCTEESVQPLQSLKYSELLKMSDNEGHTIVQIRNPWDSTSVLQTLYLLTDGTQAPANIPTEATIVKIPLSHSIVMSSTHCGLLEEMGKSDCISGVCDVSYIKSESILNALSSGSITDCGNSMAPTIEKIISTKPDAILISPYEHMDMTKLKQLGIPIIQCADYLEPSALGRAEWMKIYGKLFGCEQISDSLFSITESHYRELHQMASNQDEQPSVLTDTRYGQTWFVPSSKSTVGKLYEDANAKNPFHDVEGIGSIPLSPEIVLSKAKHADVWILKTDKDINLKSLKAENDIYKEFDVVKNGNVWYCNTLKENIFEDTPFHPDRLLEDLLYIFHPSLRSSLQLHYYHKCNE